MMIALVDMAYRLRRGTQHDCKIDESQFDIDELLFRWLSKLYTKLCVESKGRIFTEKTFFHSCRGENAPTCQEIKVQNNDSLA